MMIDGDFKLWGSLFIEKLIGFQGPGGLVRCFTGTGSTAIIPC